MTKLSYLLVILFILPNFVFPQKPEDIKAKIEVIISNFYKGQIITVKTVGVDINTNGKVATLRRLIIKVDDFIIGNIISDYLTLFYDNATIDLIQLFKNNKLKITDYKNIKANLLVSKSNFEQSIQRKLGSLGKRNIQATVNFSPPWIECKYNIPKNQLSYDTKSMILKYLIGETLEGYFALRIIVKNANLYGFVDKVILNHFLIPQSLVKTFENIYNPFDAIPTIQPFGIKIKELNVQDNYLLLSN